MAPGARDSENLKIKKLPASHSVRGFLQSESSNQAVRSATVIEMTVKRVIKCKKDFIFRTQFLTYDILFWMPDFICD
jgi:hypothetical protein